MKDERSQHSVTTKPVIGIIAWERGLPAFSKHVGDIMNPDTYEFPICVLRVEGANYKTIVEKPNRDVVKRMVEAAKVLERDGVAGLTTSCGFNAHMQKELANAVNIPVFASSLLLVPLAYRMLKKDQRVGILTADASSLMEAHFRAMGIDSGVPVCVQGLENTKVFARVGREPSFEAQKDDLDAEIQEAAKKLVAQGNVGAIVLECTNLPPFAEAIRRATNLPVFDILSLVNLAYAAVC